MIFKINTYFATLLVTIAGATAAMIIIHAANSNTPEVVFGGSVERYEVQQKQIINP
jgi:pantothenate kinase